MANNLDYIHYKTQNFFSSDDSFKEMCCPIYQIKPLVKTFILHTFSHSANFPSVLWLHGASGYLLEIFEIM